MYSYKYIYICIYIYIVCIYIVCIYSVCIQPIFHPISGSSINLSKYISHDRSGTCWCHPGRSQQALPQQLGEHADQAAGGHVGGQGPRQHL